MPVGPPRPLSDPRIDVWSPSPDAPGSPWRHSPGWDSVLSREVPSTALADTARIRAVSSPFNFWKREPNRSVSPGYPTQGLPEPACATEAAVHELRPRDGAGDRGGHSPSSGGAAERVA
eukprot:g17188.t1